MILRLGDRRPVFEGSNHFVAEGARLIGSVRLCDKASIWFNAVLRGDNDWIEVGAGSNVQDGSVLHTDPGLRLTLGDNVTVGHSAMLHGCTVGDQSMVGIGSTILNEAVIGRNSLVGANALVTEGSSFPDGVLILGAPAKVVRELEPGEISMIGLAAERYIEKGRGFAAQLAPCEPLRE